MCVREREREGGRERERERSKADTVRLACGMNAEDEQVCSSYKQCETITSRPDCRQNADNVCIISFRVVLPYIQSISIIMSKVNWCSGLKTTLFRLG